MYSQAQQVGQVLQRGHDQVSIHSTCLRVHERPAHPHVYLVRSTPRRFGKTFSIAIFCACLALSFGVEIVVFSPARRASRKLLERMVE